MQPRDAAEQYGADRQVQPRPRNRAADIACLALEPVIDLYQPPAIGVRVIGEVLGDAARIGDDTREQTERPEPAIGQLEPSRNEFARRVPIGNDDADAGRARDWRADQAAIVLETQHHVGAQPAQMAKQRQQHSAQRPQRGRPLARAKDRVRLMVESFGATKEKDMMNLVATRLQPALDQPSNLLGAGALGLRLD